MPIFYLFSTFFNRAYDVLSFGKILFLIRYKPTTLICIDDLFSGLKLFKYCDLNNNLRWCFEFSVRLIIVYYK